MDYLLAANTAREVAVVQGTTVKQALAWRRWENFLETIRVHSAEIFLDCFTRCEKHQLLGAFAAIIQRGDCSASRFLKADFCMSAIGLVAQTFTAAGPSDPRYTVDGKLAYIL